MLVRARASERPTPQRREQRAQSKYKSSESERQRKRKRIGMGQVSAMCARVRRAAARPPVHLTRSTHTPAAVAPFPCRIGSWGQEAGRGFWLPLATATADDDAEAEASREAHCRLIYD